MLLEKKVDDNIKRRFIMPADVENMFYYGEVPWHGFGTKLDSPARAEEAIVAAGMDWTVRVEDTVTRPTNLHCPHARALIREDTSTVLGDKLG